MGKRISFTEEQIIEIFNDYNSGEYTRKQLNEKHNFWNVSILWNPRYFHRLNKDEVQIIKKNDLKITKKRNENHPKNIPITVFGRKYPNIKEACRILIPDCSPNTIVRRIKSGMSPEVAFSRKTSGYAKGLIYQITNKINGKSYVGLTIQLLEERIYDHLGKSRVGDISPLYVDIRNFGWENFRYEIIDTSNTKKDLANKERYHIKEKNTLFPNGYNLSPGGEIGGSIPTPISIDGVSFKKKIDAAIYLTEKKGITLSAAKKRLTKNRIVIPETIGMNGNNGTTLYKRWKSIKNCHTNPNSNSYKFVDLCERWFDFEVFKQDVGPQPNENYKLVRIDKSIGYNPDNLKWTYAPRKKNINKDSLIFQKKDQNIMKLYNLLPNTFSYTVGKKIASNNKIPRGTFTNYLKESYYFTKISKGNYIKNIIN